MKLWLRYATLCVLFYCVARNTVLAQDLAVHIEHSRQLAVDVEHLQVEVDSQSSVARRWATPIMVDYAVDSTMPADILPTALERAVQSVSQRSGYTISRMGVAPTTLGGATGRITFVFVSNEELRAIGAPETALATTKTWYYVDSGIIAGVVVYLDRVWFLAGVTDCAVHTVSHELVHALGGTGHTSNPHDVMYPNKTHCRYALSAGDLTHLGVTQAPLGRSCFAEIMQGDSVYLPSVAGKAALLRPDGDNVWQLAQLENSVETRCDNVTVGDDLHLHIEDLRGQNVMYDWAELVFIGNDKWRLVGGE